MAANGYGIFFVGVDENVLQLGCGGDCTKVTELHTLKR